jgi:uncharacterized phiE125 gp8 family phage protein
MYNHMRPSALTRTVAPSAAPVTLDEFKLHARVDIDDDDALCQSMIDTATYQCEVETERALMTQTWRALYSCWNLRFMLPRPPLVSVTSVEYLDTDDAWQTVSSSDYFVFTDAEPAFIQFKDTFNFQSLSDSQLPIRIIYVAGYASAAAVPEAAKRAIALLASHYYEHRQEVVVGSAITAVPRAFRSLVDSIRVPSMQ